MIFLSDNSSIIAKTALNVNIDMISLSFVLPLASQERHMLLVAGQISFEETDCHLAMLSLIYMLIHWKWSRKR